MDGARGRKVHSAIGTVVYITMCCLTIQAIFDLQSNESTQLRLKQNRLLFAMPLVLLTSLTSLYYHVFIDWEDYDVEDYNADKLMFALEMIIGILGYPTLALLDWKDGPQTFPAAVLIYSFVICMIVKSSMYTYIVVYAVLMMVDQVHLGCSAMCEYIRNKVQCLQNKLMEYRARSQKL